MTERTEIITQSPGLRPGWDEWFMAGADWQSLRGDCLRRQVGAVIVDRDHRVISMGYNGAPAGKPGCLSDGACPRAHSDVPAGSDYSNCIALHAEVNAVAYGSYAAMRGATIYITAQPCDWCSKVIDAAGIRRVVYRAPDGLMVVKHVGRP